MNNTAVTFPSFLFCLIYPRLSDEVSNLEMPMAISQKVHVKPTLSSSKTRKVTAKQDRKLSDNDDLLQENTTKNTVVLLPPPFAKTKWRLDFHPQEAILRNS